MTLPDPSMHPNSRYVDYDEKTNTEIIYEKRVRIPDEGGSHIPLGRGWQEGSR